jgi:putative peptide maturation system protein
MKAMEQPVLETLDYLMTVVRSGAHPAEARIGFGLLQRLHADFSMQLLWEEEAYDRSVHYDALLNLPEGGTISISYCDDRNKPWPLRGLQRWSEADLVRVNEKVLSMDQAVACIDFIWDEGNISDRLVNVCLIQEELDRNPIEISDQELQTAMDGFRRSRQLYKAADTLRWMERRGITHHELEQLVCSMATTVKLRDRAVGHRVDDYFAAHATDLDIVRVARLRLPDQAAAAALAQQLRSRDIDFYDAAQRAFVDRQLRRPSQDELFVSLRRSQVNGKLREKLFAAAPGSIAGPVHEAAEWVIYKVLSVEPACLDDSTRDELKKMLFEEWLERRREAARVEWLWGNASAGAAGGNA